MKRILKIIFLYGIIVITAFCCEKEDIPEWSDSVEGYITGSFFCYETDRETGHATNRTKRGYCILLEGSERTNSRKPMDIYTFNLPDGLFTFSSEILSSDPNNCDCWPMFFPDSLKTKYNIKFQYRELNEEENIEFTCGFCTCFELPFFWENYKQVRLDNVTKIIH